MTTKHLGIVDGHSGGVTSADFRQTGGLVQVSKQSFEAHYVLADTGDNEDAVLNSGSIPTYSATADLVKGYLVRKSAKEISTIVLGGSTKILWIVECQFSTEGYSFLKRRWYVEVENELKYLDEDVPQVPIVNTNGEALNPEWPVSNIILEIDQIQLGAMDPDTIFSYINHTNNDTFYGAPSGCALMKDIKVDEDFSRSWQASGTDPCADIIAKITWTIQFKLRKNNSGVYVSDTLRLVKLLNEGYLTLDGDASGPTTAIPSSHPEKNGQAKKCNIVSSGTYKGMDLFAAHNFDSSLDINSCFVTFVKYPSVSFRALNLETCATGVMFTTTTTTTTT